MSTSTSIQQSYPRQVDGRIERVRWQVDLDSARRVAPNSSVSGPRLEKEVEEMTEHFPRWVLTVSRGRERILCTQCKGLLVFDDGLRCVACGAPRSPKSLTTGVNLAWFGLMPPIGIDGLPKIKRGLLAKPPPHHVVGQQPGIGNYLLVPLVAYYPAHFPRSPVQVAYLPSFFKIKGMPRDQAAHAYHMLGGGKMCLFAGREWRKNMSCREVLQQRAYAHVIKLLNFGNGKRNAFAIVS